MIQDPAIDAVRRTRKAISAEFGHDPSRLVAHYQKLQERHTHRMIPPASDAAEKVVQATALTVDAKTIH
jgi:uridine kinase